MWVLVRPASVRRLYCVPTVYIFSKISKKNKSTENIQFLLVKMSVYIAWAHFHNFILFQVGKFVNENTGDGRVLNNGDRERFEKSVLMATELWNDVRFEPPRGKTNNVVSEQV